MARREPGEVIQRISQFVLFVYVTVVFDLSFGAELSQVHEFVRWHSEIKQMTELDGLH